MPPYSGNIATIRNAPTRIASFLKLWNTPYIDLLMRRYIYIILDARAKANRPLVVFTNGEVFVERYPRPIHVTRAVKDLFRNRRRPTLAGKSTDVSGETDDLRHMPIHSPHHSGFVPLNRPCEKYNWALPHTRGRNLATAATTAIRTMTGATCLRDVVIAVDTWRYKVKRVIANTLLQCVVGTHTALSGKGFAELIMNVNLVWTHLSTYHHTTNV